ncbi:AraC family transcriptional regulator [Hyella patelloides]|uniref:AraC family transcriptional regulator n=1 Tax=Hyella patelloides TaxID=1982969 RepID=UPI001643A4A2|nr:AraC family transcriptional regulator [Hyella patelloides]
MIQEFDNLELFRAKAIHYNYARHSHPGYSIGVIESGVGGNYYRGSTYLAPPKSIILMNPEEAHTGYSAEELPLSYRMLYPSTDLINQIAREAQIIGTPYFKDAVVQNEVLAKNIFSLHTALERAQNKLEKQSLLVEVFSAILYYYADITVRSIRLNKEHQAVRLIKEYLHDNFSSNISLEQLVKITKLNRSYLIRVFRQAVGMPPYTYLNQIRMRKAKQFLNLGMSIADTANAVGMSDQSHLTRHFKRMFGITPGYYRQMSTSFKTD